MSKQRKSKFKKWILTSIIVIGIVVLIAGFLMKPKPLTYESVVAKTEDITTYYSFSGNVEAKNRQTVMSEKIMQISDIFVVEGDIVQEGTILMETTAGDEIKSKISGEVVNINVEENAQVMAGVKLLEVVDYDNLEIKVKIDEYDITTLEEGKEVNVKIGALNKEYKGNIASISREGQIMNGVTFFAATINLEQDYDIRVGMSAEVTVISDKATGVITLPMHVIQFDDYNNPYVLKKDEKDTITRAEITTGINDGTTVEIKEGVQSGEEVLYIKPAAATSMGFPVGRGNTSNAGGGDN